MKVRFALSAVFYSLIIGFFANSFVWIRSHIHSLYVLIPLFLLVNIFAGVSIVTTRRRKICFHGTILLYAFCAGLVLSILYHIPLAIRTIPNDYMTFVWSLVQCVGVLFVVFWVGILCVYLTSAQLGLRLRLIGLICGLIPIANLIILFFILKTTTAECLFEIGKEQRNRQRRDQRICATKYPILMVHGVFFRDFKYVNYWGRIPKELEANGATIFYGNQPSAASVADSAAVLKERILQILAETGAEKVNIIAHSKGGLDSRYAIANLGVGEYVASLTTVNTPHRGCLFADYLLTKIFKAQLDKEDADKIAARSAREKELAEKHAKTEKLKAEGKTEVNTNTSKKKLQQQNKQSNEERRKAAERAEREERRARLGIEIEKNDSQVGDRRFARGRAYEADRFKNRKQDAENNTNVNED